MSEEIHADSPVILFIVATSAGEVDWLLPVLSAFKARNPDWRVVTVFGHKMVFERFMTGNRTLYEEFKKVSCLNIVPQELSLFFRENIDPSQVKLIFKDYNKDEFAPYKIYISQRCPEAKVVSYPHSCHIYSDKSQDPLLQCADPHEHSMHDYFLLGSENDIPHWSQHVDTKKIITRGYPRYDSSWIERFVNDPNFKETEEWERAKRADKVFFYISRGEHPHYLSLSDYHYLVRSIAEVAESYENSLLLVKPHPRQDLDDLRRLLAPFGQDLYFLSNLHLFQLSYLADMVISGWSSGILDALALGKPVIEFWRFGGKDPLCRKTPSGEYTTIYRQLGLASGADTKEELEAQVGEFFKNPQGSMWRQQVEAFSRQCKFTDEASNRYAECLEEILAGRTPVQEALPQTQEEVPDLQNQTEKPGLQEQANTVVETIVEYVTSLVDTDETDKAGQWLEFLLGQFPQNASVLENYAIYQFNLEQFDRALEYLKRCVELHPDYIQGAVSLCHVFFLLGKKEEAGEVIVFFYGKNEAPKVREAFLLALQEQLSAEQFALVVEMIGEVRKKINEY